MWRQALAGARGRGPGARGLAFSAALAALGSMACGWPADPAHATGDKATAKVIGIDGKDLGSVDFEETLAGMLVTAKLKGLPPGAHAFHIHDIGRCEPPFASSGKILNPFNAKHGLRNEEGPAMGDMPNLYVPASGDVVAEVLNPYVTLAAEGDGSLLRETGTSVIVRTTGDDHQAQPDGNSGAPIACGVIKKAQ